MLSDLSQVGLGAGASVASGTLVVVVAAGLLLASWLYRSIKRLFARPASPNSPVAPAYRSSR